MSVHLQNECSSFISSSTLQQVCFHLLCTKLLLSASLCCFLSLFAAFCCFLLLFAAFCFSLLHSAFCCFLLLSAFCCFLLSPLCVYIANTANTANMNAVSDAP